MVGGCQCPTLHPGNPCCIPALLSQQQRKAASWALSIVKEVFPDLLPVAPVWGFGAVRAFDGSAVLWGEHLSCWSCGELARPVPWGCFGLTPGFKAPNCIFRNRNREECGVYFPSSQEQLGKAGAFRASNSVSLCKIRFCKIDSFCRLRESQRNFSVKHLKSTIISFPCLTAAQDLPFSSLKISRQSLFFVKNSMVNKAK